MRRKSAPIAKPRRKQASQSDTAVITAGEESDITYSADIPEGTDNLITEGMPLELINDSIYTMGDDLLAAGDAVDSLLILLISGGAADAFGAGKLLMVLCEMHCIPHLRNMKEDFGILLFPKYEAEQERYYHVINPNVVCAMMILTVSDPAQAGLVAEVLSTESKNYIPPAYSDYNLTARDIRDEESVGMLDIIFASITYDVAVSAPCCAVWHPKRRRTAPLPLRRSPRACRNTSTDW